MAEFDTWAAIEADCGKPCDDYYAAHPDPEEGDADYEAYRNGQAVFNKYYASHRDEIYSTNMDRAIVEGVMQGRVGPGPAAD